MCWCNWPEMLGVAWFVEAKGIGVVLKVCGDCNSSIVAIVFVLSNKCAGDVCSGAEEAGLEVFELP